MKKIFLFVTASILVFEAFAQPANDACSGASAINPNSGCVTGTTVAADDNWVGSIGCQGNGQNPDVWYTFTATNTQLDYNVTTAAPWAGNVEFTLAEATGPCAGLTIRESNCGPSVLSGSVLGIQVGVTYYITVSTPSTGTPGPFTLCINNIAAPISPGQDCTNAAVLCGNDPFSQGTFSGVGAVENIALNTCFGGNERQSKWYKFTVACSGTFEFIINPNTNTDDYDWALWNTTSSCYSTGTTMGTAIACNWSGCPGSTGITSANPCTVLNYDCTGNPNDCSSSQLSTTLVTLTAGQTYSLLIDNFSSTSGGFAMTMGGTAVIGPDAAFTFTNPSCGVYNFNKTCDTPNSTFLWTFGDGTTSNLADPSHTYVTTGVYTVVLEVTDALGCVTTSSMTININIPIATATPNPQTICSGNSANVALTSNVGGTTFSWVAASNANVGGESITAQSGATINDVLTNTTTLPQVVNYTVTPTAAGCVGPALAVPVTVNPIPTVNDPADQSLCDNTSTTAVTFTGNIGTTTYNWTNNNTSIGLAASGTGNIASFTATNTGTTVQVATITVTPTLNGCTGTPQTFTITVNPVPTVNDPADQTLCANATTTAVSFSGNIAGATYNWTNNTTSIGLAASGTGNIASFTALNDGTSPVTATITVTPTFGSCTGTAQTFTITVNPVPTVNDPADQALCANTSTTAVTFTGNSGSTTYNWTNNNTAIGLGASGTGNIASFTATNAGATAISGTITVTPVLGTCTGTPQTFTITVNPVPTVNDPADQSLCANTSTTAVSFSGNSGSTTYNWTNNNTAIGLGASGTGNIASFTATNAGATAISGTITVTPVLGTCTGTPQTFTITVNPVPTVNDPADQSLCANTSTTAVSFSGNSGSTTYNWTNNNTAIGLGASGTGNIASFTATNAGATAISGTITVTPVLGTCTGTPQTFTINVNPVPTVNDPADQSLCANTSTTAVSFSGNSGSTTYNWTNNNTAIGLGASGTGNIASFTATNAGAAAISGTITVTPVLGTCTGATQSFTITVNPVPTFSTTSTNPTSCGASDGTITLTGLNPSTGYSLSYSDDGTLIGPNAITSTAGGTHIITLLNAGGYSNITITSGGCSSLPASVSLSDPSSPVFTVSLLTNLTTCGGTQGSIHIEGTGTLSPNTTYVLTYSENGIGVAPFNITTDANGDYNITGLGAGSYTAFVLNLAGCVGSQPGPITLVDPVPPVATAGTTTSTICDGSAINLTGNTVVGGTYSWTGPNSFTSTLEDPTIGSATTAASGTYTLTITLNNCVSLPSTVNVTVNATPVLSITNPAPVCTPTMIDLTAAAVTAGSTNVGSLTYWTDAGATSAIASPSSVSTSGTYYIQANNAGCTDIAPVIVTINATPSLLISNPPAVCTPSTVNLTAASVTAGSTNVGTLTYWSDAGATVALGSPAAVMTSGTYYIQANNLGCTAIASVIVTVNQTPNLFITDPASVCSPLTVDITAPAVTTGSTNVGTLSYWSDAGATISLSTPGALTTSGTYYIQAVNTGCIAIAPVTVSVVITPTLVTNNPAAVCSPLTVDLTAVAVTAGSSNLGTMSYWTDAGATVALGSPNAVATSGTYYIQSGISGCTDIAPVVVVVNQTPNLVITDPVAVCSPSTVDITSASVTAGSTNATTLTYWTDASATSALTGPTAIATSGTYYIQATNAGCTDIAPVVVTVNQTPNLVITNPAAVCTPLTVDLTAIAVTAGSTNATSLNYWTDASATSALAGPGAVTTGGTYYIQATNAGCTDIAPVVVTVNQTPNLVINDPAAVCAPSTVDITAAAVTAGSTNTTTLTYWIDAAATSALVGPSAIATSGTYYIQATNTGCTDIAPVLVTLNQTPNLVITNPAAVCSPATVDITAAAVTAGSTNATSLTYWTDASAITSLVGPGAVATGGTYYIQATNAGCTDINPVVVTVNQTPNLVITDPAAVCTPSTVDITIPAVTTGSTNAGTLTYWTDAGATNPFGSASSVASSGTFYIQATNAGCTDIAPVLVTVNQTPNLVITNPAAVCTPATVDLTAAAVTAGSTNATSLTYWTDASATTSLVGPGAVAAGGTYYIQATNAGCTDINPVVVTVNQTPNLVITDPAAVCSPATVDLTAAAVTAGSTNLGILSYWTDAAATSILTSPNNISVSNTYYIQALNAGCTAIAPVIATINTTPSFTLAGADPSLCNLSDGSITISGLTPSTNYTVGYSDDGAAVAAAPYTSTAAGTITITGLNAGAYNSFSVTITSSGCTGTSATTVTLINPGAPVITDLADQTVCDTYTLPAITISGVATTQGYYTAPNGGGIQLAVGSSVTSTQTIYIYAINGACTDEETVLITVNNTPAIDPIVDVTACATYTLPSITGTNLSGSEAFYNNSQAVGGTVITGPITTTQTVWVYDEEGSCSDETSFVVTINPLPTVTGVTGGDTYCADEVANNIEVAVTGSNDWTIDYTLDGVAQTATGSTSPVSLGNLPGVYVVTNVTDANCTNTATGTQTIIINAIPAAPTAGTDTTYCSSWDPVDMTVTGTGGNYTWYTNVGLTSVHGTGPSIAPSSTEGVVTYYVTETLNGCEGPASAVTITIQDCEIIVPTAFTPNADGVHDTWEIVDLDDVYPNNVVTVYNRWGNMIYQSEEGQYSSKPWDGTYEGEALPVASYYFVIDFNDDLNESQTGIVSIILEK